MRTSFDEVTSRGVETSICRSGFCIAIMVFEQLVLAIRDTHLALALEYACSRIFPKASSHVFCSVCSAEVVIFYTDKYQAVILQIHAKRD